MGSEGGPGFSLQLDAPLYDTQWFYHDVVFDITKEAYTSIKFITILFI